MTSIKNSQIFRFGQAFFQKKTAEIVWNAKKTLFFYDPGVGFAKKSRRDIDEGGATTDDTKGH